MRMLQQLFRLRWHNTETDTEVTQTAVIPGEKTAAPPEMGPVHLTIEPEPETSLDPTEASGSEATETPSSSTAPSGTPSAVSALDPGVGAETT